MTLNSRLYANDDRAGNRILLRVFFDEKGLPANANVHLRLVSEKAPRLLGSVDFSSRTFYCRRKTGKHLHRKSNSFGFNWTVLNDSFLAIEKVYIIVDDTDHYRFRKSLMDEFGSFLNFKQQGFELQRFMNVDLISRHSDVPRNPKNPQGDENS